MKRLFVDGVEQTVCRTEPDTRGWFKVFVRPAGEDGGPRRQLRMPYLEGDFTVGGHRITWKDSQ